VPIGAATPHPGSTELTEVRPLSRKGRGECSPPTAATFEALLAAAFRHPTYLDKFYSVMPGRPKGAKRIIVLLPAEFRSRLDPEWIAGVGNYAAIVWRGELPDDALLVDHESVLLQSPGVPTQPEGAAM
jgi:hypothetical protein